MKYLDHRTEQKMANFLSYKASFEWENTLLDRGQQINNLNAAILKISEYKDNIFKTPDFEDIVLTWGNFIEFILCYGYDDEQRKAKFPWMTQTQHITLVYLLRYFKNTTENNATDLLSLKQEFPDTLCGYIGFERTPKIESYVFSIISLNDFHRDFVSSFNYERRCQNFKYFKRFFIPGLTKAINQIENEIRLGRCPSIISRIDNGILHGEKVHVHFTGRNPCALNIDGTWKHRNPNFVIPIDARRRLSFWGFLLPDDYYI